MLALLAVLLGGGGSAVPTCGDFLARLHRKPAFVQFVGCRPSHEAQVGVPEALYRVSGPRADAAEAYLHNLAGMPKLQRTCCVWEVPGYQFGHFNGPGGQRYFVQMGAGETLYGTREEWRKIKFFDIRVIYYLDEP